MTLESWNTFFQIGSAVLLGLTFLVGTGAIWTSQILNARLNRQVAETRLDLERQRERAANAERQLLELQQRVAWRRFTPEQREALSKSLTAAEPKGLVHVANLLGDGEANAFAAEIEGVLRTAGWQTAPLGQVMFAPEGPIGLWLHIQPGGQPPAYAVSLQQAFEAAGIELPRREMDSPRPVTIVVGTKPEAR